MELNLPKDAKGKTIPFDTECLYTYAGEKQEVFSFKYDKKQDKWKIETDSLIISSSYLYLTKPDSLKQLAADLDRVANDPELLACTYLNRDKRNCCGCKFKNSLDDFGNRNCTKPFLLDIAARVHRLCGDAE